MKAVIELMATRGGGGRDSSSDGASTSYQQQLAVLDGPGGPTMYFKVVWRTVSRMHVEPTTSRRLLAALERRPWRARAALTPHFAPIA